jgi:hypothetical protein
MNILRFLTVFVGLRYVVFASSVCATVTTGDPDDLPLRDARIEVVSLLSDVSDRYSAQTDARGRACVTRVPEGIYYVEASAAGFLHARYYPVRVAVPKDPQLIFRLPFGEIHEGGVTSDVTLSGTLTNDGKTAGDIKVCVFQPGKIPRSRSDTTPPALPLGSPPYPDLRAEDFRDATACTDTNDLGQYVLIVPPGVYSVLYSRLLHTIGVQTIEVLYPGNYHDKLSVPPSKSKAP